MTESGVTFISGGGRFGNKIFQYLATRLFSIIYNFNFVNERISPPNKFEITDNIFIEWSNLILNNQLVSFAPNIYEFNGYYQHDKIFNTYKSQLINYIKQHPQECITFDNSDVNFINTHIVESITKKSMTLQLEELFQNPPNIDKLYNTTIHLRIEDFLYIGWAMNPQSIDKILNSCEKPFLFIHKPAYSELDKKYINYFKNKYTDAFFYDGSVIDCFNLMRTSKVLVCSSSTMSWVAAFFSESCEKIYMPRNSQTCSHQTFQYPNDKTEVYDYTNCTPEELLTIIN